MPIFAVDLIFEGFQRAVRGSGRAFGWIERYYIDTLGLDFALDSAKADVQGPNTNLCALRRAFLDQTWRITYIRATDIANERVTKVASPTNFVGLSLSLLNAAQVQCAVAATIYRLPHTPDAQAHRRNVALRGLNSTLINGNVLNSGGPEFAAVVAFLNLVGNKDGTTPTTVPPPANLSRWLMAYQDTTVLAQAVTALTLLPNDPRFILLTSAGLGAVTRGDRIILKGVGNLRGVNKTWRVINDALAGAPITLGRSKFPLDTGAVPNLAAASARKRAIVAMQPDQYVIRGLTTRKTGRPINPLRGRASARP